MRGMELAIQIEWHKLIYGSSLRCNGGELRKYPARAGALLEIRPPGTTPLRLICAGLAWANNVLEPECIWCPFDVITDHPRCPPLALELEYHAKAPSPLTSSKADDTGAASVPVAPKRTIVGCTLEA